MPAAETRRKRCAIYTRKSSEEGLEQDFNSLDAQREACEAYIRSQAGEGWKLVRTRYDDGGYSGGKLERPALKQLLEDIQAGKIDTVVVYKVDRLTRSLTDFAKIVEVLDADQVSFVSVTQQFNTTTSMGRLTLNMLLSFAQFEREVTGERIRDKIAASKRKGLWMGGWIPLGYEPDGRTLTVVEAEAETVRTIYRLYLELGAVRLVKQEIERLGLRGKPRCDSDGRRQEGNVLSRSAIYHLLRNPLYAGRIPHNGSSYEGQHAAIIDPDVWASVQEQMTSRAANRVGGRGGRSPYALRGKIFDETGAVLTPRHTVKAGRHYRYYVSQPQAETSSRDLTSDTFAGWSLPAREIERLVEDAITSLLADDRTLAQLCRDAGIQGSRLPRLLERIALPVEATLDLADRVELTADQIAVHLDLSRFLDGQRVVVNLFVPIQMRRRGIEMRLVLDAGGRAASSAAIDRALVQAVARAWRWFDDLASGRSGSLVEIARAEGVSDRYIGHLLPLAFLSPDVVAKVLTGTHPVSLTTEALTKQVKLPLSWEAQRRLVGID